MENENKLKNDKLSQDFTDSLYYHIKLTEKYLKLLSTQIEESLDLKITCFELTALSLIINRSGDLNQRDLAKLLVKDRANTGRLLNSLECKGYIERSLTTKNKRQVRLISITKKGQEIYKETHEKIKPVFNSMHNKIEKIELEKIKNYLKNFREIIKNEVKIHI